MQNWAWGGIGLWVRREERSLGLEQGHDSTRGSGRASPAAQWTDSPIIDPHPLSPHLTLLLSLIPRPILCGMRGQAGGPGRQAGWKPGCGWLPEQSRLFSSRSGGLRLSERDKRFQWFSGTLINCEAGRNPLGTDKASPAPVAQLEFVWFEVPCGLDKFAGLCWRALVCFQTAVRERQTALDPRSHP